MHYTCIHEFMHTCTHTYMHACVHTYLQTVFASWELGIEKAVDRPRLSPVGWCRGLFVNDAKMFTENRQIKVTWWLTCATCQHHLWLEISPWCNLHPSQSPCFACVRRVASTLPTFDGFKVGSHGQMGGHQGWSPDPFPQDAKKRDTALSLKLLQVQLHVQYQTS